METQTLSGCSERNDRHHGGIQPCISRALAVHQACVCRAFTHGKCIADAYHTQG